MIIQKRCCNSKLVWTCLANSIGIKYYGTSCRIAGWRGPGDNGERGLNGSIQFGKSVFVPNRPTVRRRSSCCSKSNSVGSRTLTECLWAGIPVRHPCNLTFQRTTAWAFRAPEATDMRAEVILHPKRIVRLLNLLVPSCRDAASVAEAVRIVITAAWTVITAAWTVITAAWNNSCTRTNSSLSLSIGGRHTSHLSYCGSICSDGS